MVGQLSTRPYDYYSAKGYLEGILSLLNLNLSRFRLDKLTSDKEEFHPYRSAGLYCGRDMVAVFGEIHPTKAKGLGFGKSNVVMLELDLEALLNMKSSASKASIPPRFPMVIRDLAFLVDEKEDYANLRREIMRLNKTIVDVDIFYSYVGENIEKGKKSLAITISFRLEDRTLKDEEVSAVMDKIIGMLKMRFNAEVRS